GRSDGSGSEGTAAAAGRLGVRVVEHEPLADHVRVVVEHRAVEVEQALPVDEDLRAPGTFEHLITQARLPLPCEGIAQPRAAPALDADAQPTLVDALLGHQRADPARRGLGNLNHHAVGCALATWFAARSAGCFFL